MNGEGRFKLFVKMSSVDDIIFETMLRVENKDIFIDLKKNRSGVYLKISERNGSSRNTVLIPASGITRLKRVLDDVAAASLKTKVVRFVVRLCIVHYQLI